MLASGLYMVLQGLRMCFACQLCENVQFALSAICACSLLLLPHLPGASKTQTLWVSQKLRPQT